MYFNTLIIMNEDAPGYGSRSRKPSGYCKLTMPNKVSCYVQGLRQLPKGQIYKLYLISASKQKSVEVGMLQVSVNGNKETRWIMNPESINNSGINAQEIDGAFIMVNGDDIKEQVVPLVGFSSEPYIWEHLVKNNAQIFQEEIIEKAERKPEIKPEIKAEIKPEIKPEAKRETKPKASLPIEVKTSQLAEVEAKAEAKTFDLVVEKAVVREVSEEVEQSEDKMISDDVLSLREEVENLTRTIQESKAIIEALQKQIITSEEVLDPSQFTDSIKEEPLEEVSGINDYINNFIRKFQEPEIEKSKNDNVDIGEIFANRIPINPFEAQNTGIKWVRITHDDLTSFPSLDNEWINQPFIMAANRAYKHFILGRDESGITYYLGIPGVFNPSRQSELEIDKIERFSCCHNVPPRVGEAGYWIVMI